MRSEINRSPQFSVLSGKTPIQAKISDHNILINGDTLFFNIMMQARWNKEKRRFNNGFALIETQEDYQSRLIIIAQVLAEAVALNPQVEIIGLVEAPIKLEDIDVFISAIRKLPSLQRFSENIHINNFTKMGVVTLISIENFIINQEEIALEKNFTCLKDRIQCFKLLDKKNGTIKKLFNLHLPYDIAKSKEDFILIQFSKKLFQFQLNFEILVMGDFNIHPSIIVNQLNGVSSYIQQKNNLLIKSNANQEIIDFELDTVDGILRTPIIHSYDDFSDSSASFFNSANPMKEYELLTKFLDTQLTLFKKTQPSLLVESEYSDISNSKLDLLFEEKDHGDEREESTFQIKTLFTI